MSRLLKVYGLRLLLWSALSTLGCVLWARAELSGLPATFDTDARISHRLLSQRAVQHEAVLATLALLQPAALPGESDLATQRLSSVYPQILSVQRRTPDTHWTGCRSLNANCSCILNVGQVWVYCGWSTPGQVLRRTSWTMSSNHSLPPVKAGWVWV